MRFVGRLLGMLWSALVFAMVFATIAAGLRKRQILPLEDPGADEVRLVAIFEPIQFKSRAKQFRGGTLDCWYGGGVIDLREAVLDPAGAVLEVRAVLGGGQIMVPEGWRVTTDVLGMGGAGDTRPRFERPSDAPTLTIKGLVFMGGFGVSSTLPEGTERGLAKAVERRSRHTPSPETARPPLEVAS